MTDIRILPANDASNGWNRILPPRTPGPPLAGEQRADWAVVGAGYAGLAAAHRLAENRPSDRIVLLEAHAVDEYGQALRDGHIELVVGRAGTCRANHPTDQWHDIDALGLQLEAGRLDGRRVGEVPHTALDLARARFDHNCEPCHARAV